MGIAHKGDDNNTQNYIQKYTYDEVGNILSLQHIADTASYTRDYTYDTASNRLLSTTVGVNTYTYDYDTRGNITEMPHLSDMVYNHQNQLSVLDLGGGGDAYYQYSGGERRRKVDCIIMAHGIICLGW